MIHFNWPAVIVSAIVPMVIGFLYYHPKLVGGAWMKANGFTLEGLQPPKPVLYGVALVLSFLVSAFMSLNVTGPGQSEGPDGQSYVTFPHGMIHGFLLTLTIVFPVLGTLSIFEKRGWNWVFINTGYWALTLMVMGGILSAWR